MFTTPRIKQASLLVAAQHRLLFQRPPPLPPPPSPVHRRPPCTTTIRGLAIPSRWYTLEEAIDTLRDEQRKEKGDDNSSPSSSSVIQANFNLNIDPRMPGHDLRGAFSMPHHPFGNRRHSRVLALTEDVHLAQQAVALQGVGAHVRAGSLSSFLEVEPNFVTTLKQYDVVVATNELRDKLVLTSAKSRQQRSNTMMVAKRLRAAKLTPSFETKTLVEPDEFLNVIIQYVNCIMLRWRVDNHGNAAIPLLGNGWLQMQLGTDQVVQNFHRAMQELYQCQPVDFETSNKLRAKQKNRGKFVLSVFLQASQTKALPIDLSTVKGCEHYGHGPPPYYNKVRGVRVALKLHEEFASKESNSRVELQPKGHPVQPTVRLTGSKGPSTKQKRQKKSPN